ncbi:DUF6445 family protein [Sphingomonas abietis]|uniref:DUF6445 family protein n=1 Tax=Sphingomonas abietis TaxID=3012344 RepID=A0ABY7NGT9_9SPHN|nr:DUF6445 family protein [Sphingomonas abietis]WBO20704.1 DUF6445 family protein [Sphingomonas abietis]
MTTAPTIRIEHIGRERQPIIIIDDFVPEPDRMRTAAEALDYRPMGRHYPGLRAEVPAHDIEAYLAPVQDLISHVFGYSRTPEIISAGYSIVTTRPADLTPIQRLPHFDGWEAERIALLHYLDGADKGGTAFYRHRSTGYETISADRHADYDAALHRDVARHGLPSPAYISGNTPLFERIGHYAAHPNRALIYRGHLLHCADLPGDLDFTPDPRLARLTVNTFLMGRS